MISNFDRLKSDSEEFCRSKDDDDNLGNGDTIVVVCADNDGAAGID